ncbi:Leukotriene A-4 hydrolase [Armadillidium nasatum]|uniref:Leukotriene A-4 hydrolase n=1 Tax=Armadillidium nasatum TaxID=96803 RepID=A0A5N5T2M0_9CRUS|nr:Leukotriene A-4 hydrolase [Armadillidium nasatum]
MSALKDKESTTEGEMTCYRFNQPVVIPSYLIAIVVGDLVSENIGPRSKVWTEREVVKKAAHEFTETETMLSIAEQICGPYVWQQYDLLVLPPSFPYGGMENPCLTFVTPSLLAGDRSLADVIAHEICHSWTGNLVTNCNWEHFWLNEGFTMFLERKILEKMKGKSARHLSAIEGWESLSLGIETIGKDNPTTFLVPDYEGVDPDEAYSVVPYEKGHTFLWYLENLLGGPEVFDPFLKAYIEKYHHQSIDTEVFKSFLLNYFSDKAEVLKTVDWNAWLKTPGMPFYKPKFDTSLVEACEELCDKWVKWEVKEPCQFVKKDLEAFSSEQIIVLLDKILAASLSLEKIQKMNEVYQFSDSENAEIKFRWLRSCIKARWIEKLDEIIKYLNTYGRLKYVKPLYRDLYDWEEVRPKAIDNFSANKDSMMQIPISVISKVLHLS